MFKSIVMRLGGLMLALSLLAGIGASVGTAFADQPPGQLGYEGQPGNQGGASGQPGH